jgi:hypothetical protein
LPGNHSFSSSFRRFLALAVLLLLFAIPARAQKYPSVTLTWDPTLDPDVAGYRIYLGPASRAYTKAIDVGLVTTRAVPLLAGDGTYYFAVTAYNFDGLESDFSNEVSFTPIVLTVSETTSSAATTGQPGPVSTITLQWHSDPGTLYRVLYKNSLTETNWTDLNTAIVALGTNASWSEPIQSTILSRFYCVMAIH